MNFTPKFEPPPAGITYEPVTRYMVPATNLVIFHPDQLIDEVIDIITNKRISGGPVLDKDRKLVGIISEKDCLRIIIDQVYHNLPSSSRKVADYMTAQVQTVSPQTDVVEAANIFLGSAIRRLPVVENGVLLGQVSRHDILKASKNIKPAAWKH
jgi:CBS domain-containing protein